MKSKHKWKRVTGPNLQPQHAEVGSKVDKLLNQGVFVKACDAAGIPVTRRQARKFLQKKGAAYAKS